MAACARASRPRRHTPRSASWRRAQFSSPSVITPHAPTQPHIKIPSTGSSSSSRSARARTHTRAPLLLRARPQSTHVTFSIFQRVAAKCEVLVHKCAKDKCPSAYAATLSKAKKYQPPRPSLGPQAQPSPITPAGGARSKQALSRHRQTALRRSRPGAARGLRSALAGAALTLNRPLSDADDIHL